jgi:hypothetical protein
VEKEIWQGLIQISQNAPTEVGILDILRRIPSDTVQDDVRSWFCTKNTDHKTITASDNIFTFLQQKAITTTHTPCPTPLPTPALILPVVQTSLDSIQKSAAWQQLGLNPCFLTGPKFAPQTPPLTPTLPCPIDTSTSPSPTSPLLSYAQPINACLGTLDSEQMGRNNDKSPPITQDPIVQTGPTHPMSMELETNLSAASMSHPSTPFQSKKASYLTLAKTMNNAFNMNASQPGPTFSSPPNIHPRPMHTIPMELNYSVLAASTSCPSSALKSQASDKAYEANACQITPDDGNPPLLDQDHSPHPSQTNPMCMEVENNISAASTPYESFFADTYLAIQTTPDSRETGNPPPCDPILQARGKHSSCLTHPTISSPFASRGAPMTLAKEEMGKNNSSVARTAHPSSPLQTQASNKAYNGEQPYESSLAETFNKAVNMNACEHVPGTHGNVVAICKPSKKASSEAPSRSKNDQGPQHAPRVPNRKHEIIDLTIEEVSYRILFGQHILKNKIHTRFPSLNHAFSRFQKKRCCNIVTLKRYAYLAFKIHSSCKRIMVYSPAGNSMEFTPLFHVCGRPTFGGVRC